MVRKTLAAAAALLLGLAAAPAFAQSLTVPGSGPGESEAARTMAQNRRVFVGRPAPGGPAASSQAVAQERVAKPASPPASSRRVVLAEGARRGPPRSSRLPRVGKAT